MLGAIGCTGPAATFDILDYRDGAQTRRYREVFDEAYYDFDGEGNVDIVVCRSDPGREDPRLEITQVIHLRSVWRSIPGATVAESTQINGTVRYQIVNGGITASFEGAGSIFFKENRGQTKLKGTLDQALLSPKRRTGGNGNIFARAELAGEFRAKRDHRRVVRIINKIERLAAN